MSENALVPSSENSLRTSTGRIVLRDIDVSAFQHPLDLQATAQLQKMRGFDTLMTKFLEYGYERLDAVLNIASNIKVGPRQIPQLYAMLREACHVLDVPEPELYVSAIQEVNAYTFGHTKPYIVLQAGLLELMADDEIMVVLAHELGHIKCGHVLYTAMANTLSEIIDTAGKLTFGIGSTVGFVLSKGLEVALLNWRRRSELSADRAALLVMQDPHPCLSTLMKLAGGTNRFTAQMNLNEFLDQARVYQDDMGQSLSDQIYRFWASTTWRTTHPFVVERAKALDQWAYSQQFEQIMAGNYPRFVPMNDVCLNCQSPVQPGQKFCSVCGQSLLT